MDADGLSYASCCYDIIMDYRSGDLQHSKKNNPLKQYHQSNNQGK